MDTIDDFFKHVNLVLSTGKFADCNYPVFRGHSKSSYELLPTLHRAAKKLSEKDIWTLENNLYCDFRSLAGPKIKFGSSWDSLFAMRHEGIPTRLIDWTENIGTALFFALNSSNLDRPHIWILNPFTLNDREPNVNGTLVNPEEDLPRYSETYGNYCNKTVQIHEFPLAIYPNRSNERILAQRGIFTIHGTDDNRMEITCMEHLEKIEIPINLIEALKLLIKQFGINSYSVYPDLKGLCDYLKELYGY